VLGHRAARNTRRDGKSVDVLLTHAPPKGIGDGDDAPHQGFAALHSLVARLQPTLLLHGHVAVHGAAIPDQRLGRTIVRNVTGRHLLEVEPGGPADLAADAGWHRAR
jgi:Icc-related predicted phosphoesterase